MHDCSVVLVAPEIPGNTGSIGRSALALNMRLILIRPYGFDLSEKSVRRAGLDYWKFVNLTEYENWEEFLQSESPDPQKLFFLSRFAKKSLYQTKISQKSYLVFGSETKGLPSIIRENYAEQLFKLPMLSDKVRSLNLACCATAVMYESFRQLNS